MNELGLSKNRASSADLYIYYTVAVDMRQKAGEALKALQICVGQAGVVLETMSRRDCKADGTQTWMEIYRAAPADLEVRLAGWLKDSGLEAFCGPRICEWFVPFHP